MSFRHRSQRPLSHSDRYSRLPGDDRPVLQEASGVAFSHQSCHVSAEEATLSDKHNTSGHRIHGLCWPMSLTSVSLSMRPSCSTSMAASRRACRSAGPEDVEVAAELAELLCAPHCQAVCVSFGTISKRSGTGLTTAGTMLTTDSTDIIFWISKVR